MANTLYESLTNAANNYQTCLGKYNSASWYNVGSRKADITAWCLNGENELTDAYNQSSGDLHYLIRDMKTDANNFRLGTLPNACTMWQYRGLKATVNKKLNTYITSCREWARDNFDSLFKQKKGE